MEDRPQELALDVAAPDAVPTALADLHLGLPVGASLRVRIPPTGAVWKERRVRDLLLGAGFAVEDLTAGPDSAWTATVTRVRTLADTVGPGMRVLVCGLNPSIYSADAGAGFARPGNRFWPAAMAAGLVTNDRDPRHALVVHRVGMTDLVKRATPRSADLERSEYAEGLGRVERLVAWLRPGALLVVGLEGWRSAVDRRAGPGQQPLGLGGRPVLVMPSTSGRNASSRLEDLVAHVRQAMAVADGDG